MIQVFAGLFILLIIVYIVAQLAGVERIGYRPVLDQELTDLVLSYSIGNKALIALQALIWFLTVTTILIGLTVTITKSSIANVDEGLLIFVLIAFVLVISWIIIKIVLDVLGTAFIVRNHGIEIIRWRSSPLVVRWVDIISVSSYRWKTYLIIKSSTKTIRISNQLNGFCNLADNITKNLEFNKWRSAEKMLKHHEDCFKKPLEYMEKN